MKWKYYLRDDGLVFREFNGTVQYFVLDAWTDSYRQTVEGLQGKRFEKITKAQAEKLIAL